MYTQAQRLKWLASQRSLVTVRRILVHGKAAGSTARARPGHRFRRCSKAGLWVSDREEVEAHRRLLVRPVLNPAVEVSGGEVAKVNVGKGSKSGAIWAYDGSVTAVPNEIKMLKYNLVIVEVLRRGGWIPGAQIVRVLSQGVLGAFHGHHGDLVAVEQHLRSNWKICTQRLCAWLCTTWGAEKSHICLSSQPCCW